VPRNATIAVVRQAYRTLAAHFHPDTATTLSPDQQSASAEAFVRVREAYEQLVAELTDSDEKGAEV
jgi:DnaJ-class molecular chaperone